MQHNISIIENLLVVSVETNRQRGKLADKKTHRTTNLNSPVSNLEQLLEKTKHREPSKTGRHQPRL